MGTRFYHYSKEEFELDRTRKYDIATPENMKPKGLWLSVDDAWEEWCRDNEFGVDRLSHKVKIKLDMTKILHMKSYRELVEFTKKYPKAVVPGHVSDYVKGIDWAKVKKEYSGIVISPYVYQARHELFWYYGWDCQSGCVWDLSTIQIAQDDLS